MHKESLISCCDRIMLLTVALYTFIQKVRSLVKPLDIEIGRSFFVFVYITTKWSFPSYAVPYRYVHTRNIYKCLVLGECHARYM